MAFQVARHRTSHGPLGASLELRAAGRRSRQLAVLPAVGRRGARERAQEHIQFLVHLPAAVEKNASRRRRQFRGQADREQHGPLCHGPDGLPSPTTVNLLKEVPGYWVFNAMASYPLSERTSLQINLNNLTNKYYYDRSIRRTSFPAPASRLLLELISDSDSQDSQRINLRGPDALTDTRCA